MKLSDFDFELPERLIALRPAKPRPASRMLVARGNAIDDCIDDYHVHDLPTLLRPGDMLVFNDTKVIPARLVGQRHRPSTDGTGIAKIEITLIRRDDASHWTALARPAKRLGPGDQIQFGGGLTAVVIAKREAGEVALAFDRGGAELDAAIAGTGVMPLPPYIAQRRAADAQDTQDYQTIFARRLGAVAAPTAALHFDETLMTALAVQGVLSAQLTLHVGAGTFLPVKTDIVAEHRMHAEWGEIDRHTASNINAARAAGGRIIAVGTTALRLLESAATPEGQVTAFSGETAIFITPGYHFRAVDGLMTNFHLPRSTLFMLVSALMGSQRMQRIYAHAIGQGYQFYSYGDSSLLLPG